MYVHHSIEGSSVLIPRSTVERFFHFEMLVLQSPRRGTRAPLILGRSSKIDVSEICGLRLRSTFFSVGLPPELEENCQEPNTSKGKVEWTN